MRATLTAWGNTPKGEMELLTAAFKAETKAAAAADREHHPPPPDRPKTQLQSTRMARMPGSPAPEA